jgi:hypothetical protein
VRPGLEVLEQSVEVAQTGPQLLGDAPDTDGTDSMASRLWNVVSRIWNREEVAVVPFTRSALSG